MTYLEVAKVNLGGRCNDVRLVDSPERNAVDLVGTSDKEQSTSQLLQEHDALAAEAASKEDKDSAWSD